MKKFSLALLRLLIIYGLAILMTMVIHQLKPYSKEKFESSNFVVLTQDAGGITTQKYSLGNRCKITQPTIHSQYLGLKTRIKNSEWYYTASLLDNNTTQIKIQSGVFYYEYLVNGGCIHPVRQKDFSAWEVVLALVLSIATIIFFQKSDKN